MCLFIINKNKNKIKRKGILNQKKIDKRKRKMLVSRHTITQRTSGTVLTPDSFSLFDHLFVNEMMLTTSFQSPISYSTPLLSLL